MVWSRGLELACQLSGQGDRILDCEGNLVAVLQGRVQKDKAESPEIWKTSLEMNGLMSC